MKHEYIIRQTIFKFLHIALIALPFSKFLPCTKQIIHRYDILAGMIENQSHSSESTPISQPKLIPVVLKLKDAYGLWQQYLAHFPKANRFTLGSKIDDVFLNAIEYCFLASYSALSEKIIFVDKCIARVDLLKLLIQLAWDTQALDTKKYTHLSEHLMETGKMLGGWRKQLQNKTPAG
jgi:hypothetical protein